ncbi:GOLPH3/VPS74 family protein [Pengzhenrongella frigida]|nr:GPP34 family phosphoprotein [Cellulomonas sp. HLT2-17]
MTAMTLSEELLLLAHDDESDQPGATVALGTGLAGALLLDLAAEGLVVAKGKTLVGVAGTASRPLLAATLTELLASDEPRPAQHWLTQLPPALAPLRTQIATSLAERGALTEERCTALGLVVTAPWPDVDPALEHELRARLQRVLVYSGEPDAHTALLISLLRPLAMVRNVVDKHHRKQADARAKAITQATADATATPAAVARPVHVAQAAVLAAVMTATTVTTTA